MKNSKFIHKCFATTIAFIVTVTTMVSVQTSVCATENADTTDEVNTAVEMSTQNEQLPEEIKEYKSIIDQIISRTKASYNILEEQSLLSGEFLKTAGTTAGDWYAIALNRLGYEEDYQAYLSALTTYVESKYNDQDKLDAAKATEWHRIALAYLATGGDPTYAGVDSEGKVINLIADGTYDFEMNKGKALEAQGINGLAWALMALDSMRYNVPENTAVTRTQIIQKMLEQQNEDGGFALSGTESDVDVTAMVLQALALYTGNNAGKANANDEMLSMSPHLMEDVSEAVEKALDYLSVQQLENGHYATMGNPTCETASQVLIALCSLGIDPLEDERFIKNGNTVVDALKTYQLQDGGFAHSLTASSMSDDIATVQALLALTSLCRSLCYNVSVYDFRDWSDTTNEDVFAMNLFTKEVIHLQRETEFTEEDVAAYKALPKKLKNITTEYTWEVNRLFNKLKNASNKNDYASQMANLRQMKEKIEEIQQEINDINREIQTQLYREGETLTAKEAVQLISRVEYLSEYDQSKIEGFDELTIAEKEVVGNKRSQLFTILGILAVVLIITSVGLNARQRRKVKKSMEVED